jgi:hypothetical protein
MTDTCPGRTANRITTARRAACRRRPQARRSISGATHLPSAAQPAGRYSAAPEQGTKAGGIGRPRRPDPASRRRKLTRGTPSRWQVLLGKNASGTAAERSNPARADPPSAEAWARPVRSAPERPRPSHRRGHGPCSGPAAIGWLPCRPDPSSAGTSGEMHARAGERENAPEKTCKPGSVPRAGCPVQGDGHFSRAPVARRLERPDPGAPRGSRFTRTSKLAPGAGIAPLFGLAPGGVCRADPVTRAAGELLPHRFTLTALRALPSGVRRSAFCGAVRGVAPPGR